VHARCAQAYANHTGLKTYANYMLGGGYIMSADVVRALLAVKGSVKLKFTPIEDATIGMWLLPMDIRFIDHFRRVQHLPLVSPPCCPCKPVALLRAWRPRMLLWPLCNASCACVHRLQARCRHLCTAA
jgi:hypothetical protein